MASLYGILPGEEIFTFIPLGSHLNKRRTQTIMIGSDAGRGDILRAVVKDIKNKANLSPPVEALVIITYTSIWNKQLALCIEHATSNTVLVTEIRLFDPLKRWLEKSLVFFWGSSLLSLPTYSEICFPMDYLREESTWSISTFRSVECLDNLRNIFVLPPIKQLLYKAHSVQYMDALVVILSMAAVKGVSDVYLPDMCMGLFSEEDRNDISLALTQTHKSGSSICPGIHYVLKLQ